MMKTLLIAILLSVVLLPGCVLDETDKQILSWFGIDAGEQGTASMEKGAPQQNQVEMPPPPPDDGISGDQPPPPPPG